MLFVIEKESQRTNRHLIWHSLLLILVKNMLHFIGMLGIFYFVWSITFRSGILFIGVYIGQKLQS